MATAQDVQSLLRFLSQDAKVPLAQALGKMKNCQEAKIITASDIAKADFESLKNVFGDEKLARQVLNAAKRVSKKRSSTDDTAEAPAGPPKRTKRSIYEQPLDGFQLEASLALPGAELDDEKLKSVVLYTNRAPLLLAFVVTLLKYTMPEQPVSSRLSLAQAVTSVNSKAKAVNIGIDSGKTAEEDKWGAGQPLIKVMNRDIRVMKRWGYEWENASTQETLEDEPAAAKDPALWGIDLEALKRVDQPGSHKTSSELPIYTAQSARSYLLKAFETPKAAAGNTSVKRTNTAIVAEKERNLGLLLGALELLYQSWAHVLSKEDLDKRAWGWYVRMRPEVASGTAGWGGKGNVKLSGILELRRPTDRLKKEVEGT
ncbi:hypothetical protein P153DRAFT_393256 [Dothidotthia symphoricarpi CBS 119687]|uniref:Impact N-terminal domain-containing protein n=1 Tax=Dothidotthia symphoricarpi CBS 119687 TaxID=1392245 RepID=A0A6A6APH2_9PLEO|nr:uncharacterized protein P153DRAFT_393256 [Dothidotthia symphoricarpi CBS 119687]KAF2133436.1 hypothetical protein P153DRAFT_393256 [Dothidotthia symphoricarpi CBS 119687]